MELIVNNNVTFEDITHTYFTSDGVELVGITTLMRIHGISPDYSGIPESVLANAALRGKAVHESIENHCILLRSKMRYNDSMRGEVGIDPEITKLYNESGVVAIANEYLVSDNECVASSIDIVAQTDEPYVVDLVDIKTTYKLHKEPLSWQLSFYAYLFEMQNPHLKVRYLYGLHIRDGAQKLVKVDRKSDEDVKEIIECQKRSEKWNPDTQSTFDLQAIPPDVNLVEMQNIVEYIIDTKLKLKAAQEKQDAMSAAILAQMEDKGLSKVDTPYFTITKKDAYERKGVDSSMLKEKYPDIYKELEKTTVVKSSLTIKLLK